jgi:hypothetical protein
LFEATHKNSVADNVGNHPNAYFSSARQYHKDSTAQNAKKSEEVKKNDVP